MIALDWGRLPQRMRERLRRMARPADVLPAVGKSTKYRCMGSGYGLRPAPPGLTRTEAFCMGCDAPWCALDPEITPPERVVLGLVRLGRLEDVPEEDVGLIPWALNRLGKEL